MVAILTWNPNKAIMEDDAIKIAVKKWHEIGFS